MNLSAALLTFTAAVPAFASVGEARSVTPFDALEVSNAISAKVTQGDVFKVRVEANDASVLKRVVTEVTGNTLKVRLTDDAWCFRCEASVEIVVPKLSRLSVSGAAKAHVDGNFGPRLALSASGAGQATVSGLSATAITAKASGASNLELTGKVSALELEASGASEIKAHKLDARTVKAEVSGASDVQLRAQDGISAEVSGASHLTVKGKPTTRHVETSGASDVSWND